MSKGPEEPKITEEEAAFAETAVSRWNDYQTRLKPFEDQYMQMIQRTEGDHTQARGDAASAVTQAFQPARQQMEQQMFQRGAKPGSGQHAMRTGALATDEATVRGIGTGEAHGAVQAQHLQGLQNVVRLGQGQSNLAYAGLGSLAANAAQDAQFRAKLAAQQRAGIGQAVGTAAGAGLAYSMHGRNQQTGATGPGMSPVPGGGVTPAQGALNNYLGN